MKPLAAAISKLADVHDKRLGEIASALRRLGVNDAATQMGAIEALGLSVEKGLGEVREGLDGLSSGVNQLSLSLNQNSEK